MLDETIAMPWDREALTHAIGRAFVGMAVGAVIFAIVSCLRNMVLRAK